MIIETKPLKIYDYWIDDKYHIRSTVDRKQHSSQIEENIEENQIVF